MLVGLGGCEVRVKADFEAICNAFERSGAKDVPHAERAAHLTRWLEARITTERGRHALVWLSGAHPDRRGYVLDRARVAGYEGPCPFLTEPSPSIDRLGPLGTSGPP